MSAFDAALSAGVTRLRPVLMTAAAMVVGMIPMAIGGPGEEQNAVLARAVLGGGRGRHDDHVVFRSFPLLDHRPVSNGWMPKCQRLPIMDHQNEHGSAPRSNRSTGRFIGFLISVRNRMF